VELADRAVVADDGETIVLTSYAGREAVAAVELAPRDQAF
jgi:hypothetical protein